MNNYTVDDATHKLKCIRTKKGTPRTKYYMPCLYIKQMPNKLIKVIVFGSKDIPSLVNIQKVRYVPEKKLVKI